MATTEIGGVAKSEPAVETVLVVDDDDISRQLLRGLIETVHYAVIEARDGVEAVRLAAEHRPGCILLDLFMPNLNGADACRAIKSGTDTAMIPVIVISGHGEREARIEAIKAGADDFLTKPYDPDEVLLRVRNSIQTKHLYDRAQDDLLRLRNLEQTKESLTHMLIHDLRQPLSGIKAYSDYLTLSAGEEMSSLVRESLLRIGRLVDTAESMIANILDITRLEDGQMPINISSCDLEEILSESVENVRQTAANEHVEIEYKPMSCAVRCDRDLVRRVAENLLSNAIKHSRHNATITVGVEAGADSGEFYVKDHGFGIPEEFHHLIFEKYGQVHMHTQGAKYSSGLGLAFCKLAVEANKGTISLESSAGKGATFRVRLPRR